jgi:hypothetical protein
MDEIELLRTFRVDPLGPDLGTTERARAKLRTAIALERGEKVAASRPRWRRRRLIPAALVATAAVAIAALVVVTGSSGPGVSEAAAEALRQQARIAAGQPAFPPPGPGQYLYTKTREMFVNNRATPSGGWYHYRNPVVRESWLGTDGRGRLRTKAGKVTFLTSEDRAEWRADGSPNIADSAVCSRPFCDEWQPHGLRVWDLSNVTTDPAKLRQLIEERKLEGGPPGDGETFVIISDMLRETYAPPKLRAALYRVASELPGIELLGKVHDGVGREGVGVAYIINGMRDELIFNPETSAILGERSTIVDPETAEPGDPSSFHAGLITEEQTYLKSGVVDSRSVRP